MLNLCSIETQLVEERLEPRAFEAPAPDPPEEAAPLPILTAVCILERADQRGQRHKTTAEAGLELGYADT